MVRRVLFTGLALVLAAEAFAGADPQPDINVFGVLFLFFAFVAWFCWGDIQAGYAYLDDRGERSAAGPRLLLVRLGPMLIRELVGRKTGSA